MLIEQLFMEGQLHHLPDAVVFGSHAPFGARFQIPFVGTKKDLQKASLSCLEEKELCHSYAQYKINPYGM